MNIHRKYLLVVGLLASLLFGLTPVQAGNADPQTGYNSLYDNILEKGVNNGRCNAIGALGGVICGSTGTELVPPINPVITDLCEAIGVVIELPYETCYQPVNCVVEWGDWSDDCSGGIGEPAQFRCGTVTTPAEHGGTCPPEHFYCPDGQVIDLRTCV